MAPAELQQVAWGENETFLTLKDGSMLTARLVIGADGANSWLRNKADIPLTFWDYQHHALVATIRTEEPHDAVARQVFHGEGILAFLPLSDPHLCSIVWSLSPEEAQRMQVGGFLWMCAERRTKRLRLLPLRGYETPQPPLTPVLALDLWEHAYITRYGNDRRRYADMFLRQLDWEAVGQDLGAL